MKKGFKHSKETKKKMSLIKKGKKRKPFTNDHKLKMSISHIGKTSGMQDKKHSKEAKKKMKKSAKTCINSGRWKNGSIPWNKNKKVPSCGKIKEAHWNWKGGISEDNYSDDWTDELRDLVRKRDEYICKECGIHQDELSGFYNKLDVHHIDYDKENCNPTNLISLCRKCHMKTNQNREYWINYFADWAGSLK